MDINKIFPSNYLGAPDLNDKDAVLEMSKIVIEDIRNDQKPVLYFAGIDKGLVLNKTNANVIAGLYGCETNGWWGKKIALFPTQTEFQGQTVECIRVRLKAPGESLKKIQEFSEAS